MHCLRDSRGASCRAYGLERLFAVLVGAITIGVCHGLSLVRSPYTYDAGKGMVLLPSDGVYENVVLFLHGLGDTCDGWGDMMPMLHLEKTKYVLPTAVQRPISMNGNILMPAWFDVHGLSEHAPEDVAGFADSSARVDNIVRLEKKEKHDIQIVVGGFSQGGALALHYSLRTEEKLAGTIGLSCWLPFLADYPEALKANALRVLQLHGEEDTVVKLEWAKASHAKLVSMLSEHGSCSSDSSIKGPHLQFKSYRNMAHGSSVEEMEMLRKTLASWLVGEKRQ